jgi:hypothetical protein
VRCRGELVRSRRAVAGGGTAQNPQVTSSDNGGAATTVWQQLDAEYDQVVLSAPKGYSGFGIAPELKAFGSIQVFPDD